MARPHPTPLYHFTAIAHLPTIREHGLVSDTAAHDRGLLTTEVGNQSIKQRRRDRDVDIAPHGVLADYVPFYFAPRSPMLYAIHKGNVPGYTGGSNRLAYLVTSVERLCAIGLPQVYTDRNAVLHPAHFTTDPAHSIRWSIGS